MEWSSAADSLGALSALALMGTTSLGHAQTMRTREWAALDHSMTLKFWVQISWKFIVVTITSVWSSPENYVM